jgi:hypothetical protein
VADQESRGCAGDSGTGETESVMRMNLAEGCRAVNGETLGLFCLSRLSGLSGFWLNETNQMNQINQINKTNQINQTNRARR